MPAHIHDGRIITPFATRAIFSLFKQELKKALVTWPEYKKEGGCLNKLYDRWKECNFKFSCSEEDVRKAFEKHVEIRYPDWMRAIRNNVFVTHKTPAARYSHCPKGINKIVWPKLVEAWLDPKWQKISERNKSNRDQSTIVHTGGSVPMAKWRKKQLDRNGVEPSPIECWRKFHVSKAKDSKEEHWKSEKAKEIYEDFTERRDRMEEAFGEADETDDWEIYEKVICEHSHGRSHGRALGLGTGAKLKEMNPHNQSCQKPGCLEIKAHYETVKAEVEILKDKLEKLTEVQNLLPRSSENSKSTRNSDYVDNIIATDSSALHDEDADGTNGDEDNYGEDDIDGYGTDEAGSERDGADEDGES